MKFGFTRREIKPVTEEQENDFRSRMEENHVGFKDAVAMLLGAFITVVLPCLCVLGLLAFLSLWMFGAF